MMVSDIDLLFLAYLHQSGKRKQDLADHLCISPQSLTKWLKEGIASWRLEYVTKAAQYLGIPIDVLREVISYRKG